MNCVETKIVTKMWLLFNWKSLKNTKTKQLQILSQNKKYEKNVFPPVKII